MPARPRRRAVGPAGALPAEFAPPRWPDDEPVDQPVDDREDERLRADRPPHHDRGV